MFVGEYDQQFDPHEATRAPKINRPGALFASCLALPSTSCHCFLGLVEVQIYQQNPIYPLVIEHSHGKWPVEIDGLPNLKMVDLSMAMFVITR